MLAAFSLGLPHTPPKTVDETTTLGGHRERLAWLEALKVLRHPFVLVLWIATLLDSFVHNCYFNWTGEFLKSETVGIKGNWVQPVMSIGQITVILTMLILGKVLTRLGWKATMVLGILGVPRALCRLRVFSSVSVADHPDPGDSRHLLCLLLRDCLYLR